MVKKSKKLTFQNFKKLLFKKEKLYWDEKIKCKRKCKTKKKFKKKRKCIEKCEGDHLKKLRKFHNQYPELFKEYINKL